MSWQTGMEWLILLCLLGMVRVLRNLTVFRDDR